MKRHLSYLRLDGEWKAIVLTGVKCQPASKKPYKDTQIKTRGKKDLRTPGNTWAPYIDGKPLKKRQQTWAKYTHMNNFVVVMRKDPTANRKVAQNSWECEKLTQNKYHTMKAEGKNIKNGKIRQIQAKRTSIRKYCIKKRIECMHSD